jgi:hypothetical protein
MSYLMNVWNWFEATATELLSSEERAAAMKQLEPLRQALQADQLPSWEMLDAAQKACQDLFAQKEKKLAYSFGKLVEFCQRALQGQPPSSRDATVEHLRGAWPKRACAGCGGNSWHVSDDLYKLERNRADGVIGDDDARRLVVIPVVCAGCGMTLLFSAAHAGIAGRIGGFAPLPP